MDRRRVIVLAVALLLPIAGLEARLVHLQILSRGRYTAELHTRRRSLEIAAAPRGRILDRQGRVLAEDRRAFDLYVVLEEIEKSPGVEEKIARRIGVPPEVVQQRIEEIYRRIETQMNARPKERLRILARERRVPYLLERDIEFEAAFEIETCDDRYPGAVVREGLRRVYPCLLEHEHRECPTRTGAHLLGYVGRVSENEAEYRAFLQSGYFTEGFEALIGEDALEGLKAKGVFMDELVGRDGAERSFNGVLRGKYGLMIFEREPGKGREMVELVPAVAGQDVSLTIDWSFQSFLEEELSKLSNEAAAVVLDPHTGEVVGMATNSSFDPNAFVPPKDRSRIREYFETRGALRSIAFRASFPLGSVFKIVTAAAGLENGHVTPSSTIECRGKLRPDLQRYNCHIWNNHRGMHGPLDLNGAMERSCNIYFFTLGEQLGVDGLDYWARQFGLGQHAGVELKCDVGRLPRSDSKSFAIGQGELLVSPLQVAVMMSTVANGGRRVTPHFRRGGGAPPQATSLSPATIDTLRRALRDVVHGDHGTAKDVGLREVQAAGKTGTAQSERRDEDHAWFAGYAPMNAPKYVVVVFVRYGGHGGEVAGPVAARVFGRLLK